MIDEMKGSNGELDFTFDGVEITISNAARKPYSIAMDDVQDLIEILTWVEKITKIEEEDND